MARTNCWEAKRCGREPGGAKAGEMGVCPAATAAGYDGIHGGKNAGRACWVMAGTLCGGTVQGSFATKLGACQACDFYQTVRQEEGSAIIPPAELLKRSA